MKGRKSTEEHLLSRYTEPVQIGKGAYARVFRAKSKDRVVALKVCSMLELNCGIPTTVIREISLLRSLDHPHIVHLLDVCFAGPQHVVMELEYMETDVSKLLNSQRTVPVKEIMQQLLQAVSFCHSNRVLHRDIKPQNILINETPLRVCLADFGMAKKQVYPTENEKGVELVTLWYRAPEALQNEGSYTEALDMWSVGCVFAELLTHRPLFAGKTAEHQLTMIKEKQTKLSNQLGKFQKEWSLLKKMLCMDSKARISASSSLSHPYFTD